VSTGSIFILHIGRNITNAADDIKPLPHFSALYWKSPTKDVGNLLPRSLLQKAGYTLSPDSEAVLRAYYPIPEDRLKSSVTYEKAV